MKKVFLFALFCTIIGFCVVGCGKSSTAPEHEHPKSEHPK